MESKRGKTQRMSVHARRLDSSTTARQHGPLVSDGSSMVVPCVESDDLHFSQRKHLWMVAHRMLRFRALVFTEFKITRPTSSAHTPNLTTVGSNTRWAVAKTTRWLRRCDGTSAVHKATTQSRPAGAIPPLSPSAESDAKRGNKRAWRQWRIACEHGTTCLGLRW